MSGQAGPDHPTLFAYAGGRQAILRLADAHYRRCLTDPVLREVFGTTARPNHTKHLADWLTEVFGGERLYTQLHDGHGTLLAHHANLQIQEHQRARFVEVFLEAADEVGLPSDERFRARLLDYLQWGSQIAREVSQPGADITTDQPVPVWDWGPQGPPDD